MPRLAARVLGLGLLGLLLPLSATATVAAAGPCAALGEAACPLQVVRTNASAASCACFESPPVAPAPRAMATMVMDLIAVGALVLVIVAWRHIPSKQKYPNSLVLHLCVFGLLGHIGIGLSALTGTQAVGALVLSSDGTWTRHISNMAGPVCSFQSSLIYFSFTGMMAISLALSITLYYGTVKMKQMAALEPWGRRQVYLAYAAACMVGALPLAFGTANVYSMYCAVVEPLAVRNVFYVPLFLGGVVGVPYIFPVVHTIWNMYHDTGGNNPTRGGATERRRRNSADKVKSLKKNGVPVKTLLRMAGFAFVFIAAIMASSVKRMIHSFSYATYYETPDAGKVGLTEYVASTVGLGMAIVFGYQRDVFVFYGLSKAAPVAPSAVSTRFASKVQGKKESTLTASPKQAARAVT